MLAESFLSSIAYKAELQKPHTCQAPEAMEEESWRNHLVEEDVNGGFCTGSEKMEVPRPDVDLRQETCHHQMSTQKPLTTKGCNNIPLSSPQCIPWKEQHCEKDLDLYRSWSNQSLYQNYPDLHIGGDHIADHMCDSGCIMDQGYGELPTGPVLFSKDIPLRNSPVNEPLQRLKAIKFYHGDECGERTLMLHKEPLSNSMINNYMEAKVHEFYKQFLEEKLARCSSVTHSLASSLLMNNINELPQEQHTEASKAFFQSLALLGLKNTSCGPSSEFTTPNLQISAPLCNLKSSVVQSTS